MRNRIVIVGAGLTGLSTAYHLEMLGGTNYIVYEKGQKAGGLCRSEYLKCDKLKGYFTFDILGHLIHMKEKYTKKLVKSLLRSNLVSHIRNSWIYSKGIYTRYPFQANTYGLPKKVVKECLFGLIDARSSFSREDRIRENESFYEWILRNFGTGIAKHFMVPYNEKLWTVHPKQLTCEWLKYVPSPSIQEAVIGALERQRKRFGYNVYFYYPRKGGIQAFADALAKKVRNLRLGKVLTSVDLKRRVAYFNEGEIIEEYRFLVSTIPLKELLLKVVDDVPFSVRQAALELRHTSVLSLNFGIGRENIDRADWIYFPEKKYPFYRVGFPQRFSDKMCPQGTSSIYCEIAYKPGELPTARKKEIISQVEQALISTGILRRDDKILICYGVPVEYAYVIYDRERAKNVQIICDYLEKHCVYSVGRYGGWKYSTMEDAILEGKEVAEKITSRI